jgi:mannose-6-phosphate isomerase-like protein (cupin superfamily)
MENAERGATRVASGAGKTLWVLGDLYEFKATAEDTGGRFALWETTTPPGNPGPPPHIHHNEDEVFYLLEGELELMVEGRASVVGAGTFVDIPKKLPTHLQERRYNARQIPGPGRTGGVRGLLQGDRRTGDGHVFFSACRSTRRREDHGYGPEVRPRDTASS